MTRERDGFDRSVSLPLKLTVGQLRNAMEYIEEQAEELIDLYNEQAKVFSGVIGIFGIKALHSFSPYKRHKHPDIAQQRFPDLSLGGRLKPPPKQALESKWKHPALGRAIPLQPRWLVHHLALCRGSDQENEARTLCCHLAN